MRILKLLCGLWVALVVLVGGVYLAIPDPLQAVLHWPVSPVLLDSRGDVFHARLSGDDEWCMPLPLEEMGYWLPKVAVAVEDRRFYAHRGVDLPALCRAVLQNIHRGRVVSGASTITSQLVRISQPRPRTMATKVMEFLSAWKLETRLGKRQILELYLNRAPFGGPIRGVEAASRLYFGKRAKDLSLGEASLLIGMLKGPTALRPDKHPQRALQRRQAIITQVAEATAFSPELTALALKEPLPVFRTAMPQKAWHFADLVVRTSFWTNHQEQRDQAGQAGQGSKAPYFDATASPGAGPDDAAWPVNRPGRMYSAGIVHTTLDSSLQTTLETTLNRSLARLDPALTAAGIVVENATGAIRAYVGNARFSPQADREWVDCAIAPRSPGSTLKPFIYLAALEKGLLVPESLLADTPLSFRGQAPRNFSRTYLGPVSTRFALAHSLNAPAVRVQRMIGVQAALRALRAAGFAQMRAEGTYGDSLVLGAGEVTLLELARAYTALASLGMDKPLVYAFAPDSGAKEAPKGDRNPSLGKKPPKRLSRGNFWPSGLGSPVPATRPDASRLYSQPAAWLVADILGDATRLPFITQLTQAREERPIAFKTGTSFGLRDAWCAAYFPGYTVVVWYGQARGGANSALVGISAAAPVALQLARTLAGEQSFEQGARRALAGKRWYEPPDGIIRVRVCALSGASPSAYCPNIIHSPAIEGVYRTTPCTLHALRDGKITILWPPELEDFAARRKAGTDMSRPPHIVSPLPGVDYLLTPGVRNQPVLLHAEDVAYPVYWYSDGEFVGTQHGPQEPLYWPPTAGRHTLSLLDSQNKTASLTTTVIDLARQAEENRLQPLF